MGVIPVTHMPNIPKNPTHLNPGQHLMPKSSEQRIVRQEPRFTQTPPTSGKIPLGIQTSPLFGQH